MTIWGEMPIYEVFCGMTTAMIVAPIMTIIDTSIIRSQLQSTPLKTALSNTVVDYANKTPFAKPLAIMAGVYASTYTMANLCDYSHKKCGHPDKTSSVLATSVVNVCAISYKDREYAKLFVGGKYAAFPKKCYVLFAMRDMATIYFSFFLKKDAVLLGEKYLPHNSADFVSSLILPISAQIVSTPIHILAIDLYQRPNIAIYERWNHITTNYKSICLGRMMRVIPAFCIGGFVNDMLRERKV